jgi:hypothetical protein
MKKTLLFLKKEILEMIPSFIFFLIVFQAIEFISQLLLSEYGIHKSSLIPATIDALIVSKSILIANSFAFLKLFNKKALILDVLWKIVIYLNMILLIQYLEELIGSISTYHSFKEAFIQSFTDINWQKIFAKRIILLLFLFIFVVSNEFVNIIGKEKVVDLFFKKPKKG